MELHGHGFKSHADQLSIATSNNHSVVNIIYFWPFQLISSQGKLLHLLRCGEIFSEYYKDKAFYIQ